MSMYQILKTFLVLFFGLVASLTPVLGQELGTQTIIRKVVSQNKDEFNASVRSGFSEYLTIMSGNSRVSEFPQVAPLIAQADKFLLEFRYVPLAESDLEIVSEFEQSQQAKWRLKLRFDHKAVELAMFNAGAPIWPLPRPQLMVWLAQESDLGLRTLVTSQGEDSDAQREILKRVAHGRGIELTFPEFDDKDQRVLSASALWGLFQEDIALATEQYQLKNSVAVRIYPSVDDTWQFNGLVMMPGATQEFTGVAASHEEAVAQVMNEAINQMANHYAIQVDPDDQRHLILNVAGVKHYDQLHQMMVDINNLLVVKDVTPMSLKGNDVRLSLKILGDQQLLTLMLANKPYLAEIIKMDNALVPPGLPEPVEETVTPGIGTEDVNLTSGEVGQTVKGEDGMAVGTTAASVTLQSKDVAPVALIADAEASKTVNLYYQYQEVVFSSDSVSQESTDDSELLLQEEP